MARKTRSKVKYRARGDGSSFIPQKSRQLHPH